MKAMHSRLAILAAVIGFAACGGDDPTSPAPEPEPDPVVDPALVGTWNGRIQGSGGGMSGSADIQLKLLEGGFLSASVSNLPFHPIPSGSWGIVGDEFRASATDSEGNTGTFEAPRSETRLQGTWRAGSGSGTFDVTKQ
jgi:hypothetical protein